MHVSFRASAQKFIVQVRRDGNLVYRALFDDEIEAALHADAAVQKFFKDFAVLNFPASASKHLIPTIPDEVVPHTQTSDYRGVCVQGASSRAYIKTQGKQHSLGSYATQEEAALVYDQAAIAAWGQKAAKKLNFPELFVCALCDNKSVNEVRSGAA
jgi:hypothetical protein